MNPIARKSDLIIENQTPEFFIHDLKNEKFITLNPTSAYVWKKCDGNHSKDEIVKEMEEELGLKINPGLIDSAIARLSADCLLETYPQFI